MKVIENDSIVYCDRCASVLTYDKEDIEIGAFGAAFIECPNCKNKIMVCDEGIDLTRDNLRFPTHYWKNTVEEKISDKMVDAIVKNMIDRLTICGNGDFIYTDDNNMFIIAIRDDIGGEYKIYAATNGYFETAVPIEENEDG